MKLPRFDATKIIRHNKIISYSNPYDKIWDGYFEQRARKPFAKYEIISKASQCQLTDGLLVQSEGCLSRVRRKSHTRFLEGKGRAISPTYSPLNVCAQISIDNSLNKNVCVLKIGRFLRSTNYLKRNFPGANYFSVYEVTGLVSKSDKGKASPASQNLHTSPKNIYSSKL